MFILCVAIKFLFLFSTEINKYFCFLEQKCQCTQTQTNRTFFLGNVQCTSQSVPDKSTTICKSRLIHPDSFKRSVVEGLFQPETYTRREYTRAFISNPEKRRTRGNFRTRALSAAETLASWFEEGVQVSASWTFQLKQLRLRGLRAIGLAWRCAWNHPSPKAPNTKFRHPDGRSSAASEKESVPVVTNLSFFQLSYAHECDVVRRTPLSGLVSTNVSVLGWYVIHLKRNT